MKKLLLGLAAVALSAMSASAQWAVVGSYTDPSWNFEASTKFTGEGDNLTCTISNLTSDFKIVDITNNSWDEQYGTSTAVQVGEEYTLIGKNGNDDAPNIKFAAPVLAVKNATVSWNPTTHVMKISAAEADLVKGNPTLYVTGGFCSWADPGKEGSVLATEKDGIYTATFNLGTSGNVEFKLAGEGWSNEIAGGATITADAAAEVTQGGSNLKTTLTGEQTLTFNMNTMLMTFGDLELTMTEEKPARTWALVGSYTDPNWNLEAATKFTGEGDNLTCTIDKLITGFKIVDITNNNWDIQYGTATPIQVGVAYVLDGKNGGPDPANMEFATPIIEINNATVSWSPSTYTMTITAAESDIVKGYPTLYVTGSFCSWAEPGNEGSVECEQNDGVYTAVVNLGDDAETEFKLAGTGWSNQVAGGFTVGTEPTKVTMGGDNLKTNLNGELLLVFNINTMEMYFSEDTGVASPENVAAETVYFNLQGVRVANPDKGIYIMKQGSKTTKIVK